MPKNKFYLTTSLVYTNAKPHIGFALELAQADAIARWQRLQGRDVYFLTGTDEHGVKIYQKALEEGKEPQQFVDEITKSVKNLADRLNISYTDFIRTTDEKRHWPAAQALWEKLSVEGSIKKGHYKGYYSVNDESYITKTDYESGAYADKKVIELEEDNYLFKLGKYTEELKKTIGKSFIIVPEHRTKETLNFINEGLTDISFSRPKDKLPWGIPVPGDASQVMYVWCDALTNYIGALGYPNDKYKKYWPADLHIIGKDILKFHTIYWPAMLLGADIDLPKKILIHGHILSGGQKMSKSVGNVIDPIELIDKWGADAVRYYLLHEIPTTDDGDFSAERFVESYNSALANDLGNLLSRTLTMAVKFTNNQTPSPVDNLNGVGWNALAQTIENFQLDRAIGEIWSVVSKLNQYIDQQKPWELAKTNPEQIPIVMYNLLESLRQISIVLYPFLPETSDKISKQLGLEPINPENFNFEKEIQWGGLPEGHQLGQSEILFPKQEGK